MATNTNNNPFARFRAYDEKAKAEKAAASNQNAPASTSVSGSSKSGSTSSSSTAKKATTIYDENTGKTLSGYIQNGQTYLNDGSRVSNGMVVKTDGGYYRKTDSGSEYVGNTYANTTTSKAANTGGSSASNSSAKKATTIYDENTGKTLSGYIQNGQTYLNDGNRVSNGMVVKTDGGYYRMTDNGSEYVGNTYSGATPAQTAQTQAPASATQTAARKATTIFDENTGKYTDGYIENGLAYLNDGSRVRPGMVVKTDGGYYRMTDNGSEPLGDSYSFLNNVYQSIYPSENAYTGERFVTIDGMTIDMDTDYTALMEQYRNDPQALKALEEARNAKIKILMNNGVNDYSVTNDYGNIDYANTDDIENAYDDYIAEQELLRKQERDAVRSQYEAEIADIQNRIYGYGTANDEAMRQAYINNMLNRLSMNEILAARGLTGGARDMRMMGLDQVYENDIAQLQADRIAEIASLEQMIARLRAEMGGSLTQAGAAYNNNIANAYLERENRRQNAQSDARAAIMARLGLA